MKSADYTKLRREYERLPITVRLARVEFLANYYLSQITRDASVIIDATKHWPQYAEMARQAPAIDAGATTMEQALNSAGLKAVKQ